MVATKAKVYLGVSLILSFIWAVTYALHLKLVYRVANYVDGRIHTVLTTVVRK